MKRILITSLCILHFAFLIAQNSPYIHRVYEYMPAPGQFVNELPEYETGDDAAAMCRKAEEAIADNNRGMISLGGWGGYVVFGFDHPVVNAGGTCDLVVEGNSFYSDKEAGPSGGGSSEPGIVMVSVDGNGNGKPDDMWYELAGSEYNNPQTRHNYKVMYARTEDWADVPWRDNEQHRGVIAVNLYHKHSFYPLWAGETLSFTGARLPDNYRYLNEQYIFYPYAYGYADNHPNDADEAQLDIDWAVNNDGSPVHLPAIDFVKVYTALHQQCGSVGETSTEIIGARDLHPEAIASGVEGYRTDNNTCKVAKLMHRGQLVIIRDGKKYNPLGTIITSY